MSENFLATSASTGKPPWKYTIPFNKPYYTGHEMAYVGEAFRVGQTAGNGIFTRRCQGYFEKSYGFARCLLTQSCTDALEMCALLARLKVSDEVIVPSYTFVSSANAFVLRGADVVFADSESSRPHIDPDSIEQLISPRTRAVVVVHYGGTACDMTRIMDLARRHGLLVIEDAAHGIDSRYKEAPLGSIGDLATFSFHETKNIISGEGGMLVVNREEFQSRAEILWEKGTNRSAFFRGEVAKYQWMDVGSSFLPSELTAATLWSQLESLEVIQGRRVEIWKRYDKALVDALAKLGVGTPVVGPDATVNGHLYYLVCRSLDERTSLIGHLRERGIHAVFHYQSLHASPFYAGRHRSGSLPNADRYSDCLLRLPMYFELKDSEIDRVIESVLEFYAAGQS